MTFCIFWVHSHTHAPKIKLPRCTLGETLSNGLWQIHHYFLFIIIFSSPPAVCKSTLTMYHKCFWGCWGSYLPCKALSPLGTKTITFLSLHLQRYPAWLHNSLAKLILSWDLRYFRTISSNSQMKSKLAWVVLSTHLGRMWFCLFKMVVPNWSHFGKRFKEAFVFFKILFAWDILLIVTLLFESDYYFFIVYYFWNKKRRQL